MTDTIEARWEAHNEAGRRYFSQGDYPNAEQAFVAAIREATALGGDNVRLASSLSNLGQLKYKQKDLAQAEALFRRSLAIRETVLGPEHFGLVQNLNNLAALHYARGELEQAEPLFRRALTISEKALGEDHADVAVTLNNLARLYFRRNDFKNAAPLLLRLLAIKQEALGASHPEVAAILTSLAKVRYAEGEYDAGEQLARRALGIREKIHVPNDPAIATALETLAEICGARGKRDEEMDLRTRALAIREASMGADHPTVAASRATLELRRVSVETVAMGEISGEFSKFDPHTPVETPALRHDSPPGGIPMRLTPLSSPAVVPPAGATPAPPAAPTPQPFPPIAPRMTPPVVPAIVPAAPPPAPAAVPMAAAQSPGNAPAASAPPAPAVTPPAPPATPLTTTKSTSLPWIESPNSPALARRPTTPPVQQDLRVPPKAHEIEAEIPAVVDRAVKRTPAEQYASLLTHSGSAPLPAVISQTHAVGERREGSVEDWSPPRRKWVVYAIAAGVVVAVGVTGWLLFGRGALASRAAAAASPPPGQVRPVDATLASKTTPIVKDSASADATQATKTDGTPSAADGANGSARGSRAGADQPDASASVIPRRSQTVLPTVNLDKITKGIEDSARVKVDSAGRALNVAPPTFQTRPPSPP